MTDVRQCCCTLGKEFKAFALQGNIFDLAVGLIIGTAFQNVVKSLVNDIITPPFGLIFDGVDFSNLTIKMRNFVHQDQPPVCIRYGLFLQQIIHLLVMALALFGIVKLINRLSRISAQNEQLAVESESTPVIEPTEEVKLLRDIRDLLVECRNASVSPSIISSSIERSPNLINFS